MNKYERFHETHEDKTYDWLLYIVNQEIRLQRQNRNTVEREALLKSGPPIKVKGAAPAEIADTPKGKGKDRTPEQKAQDKLLADAIKKLKASEATVADVTSRFAAATLGGFKEKPRDWAKAKPKVEKVPKETNLAIIFIGADANDLRAHAISVTHHCLWMQRTS